MVQRLFCLLKSIFQQYIKQTFFFVVFLIMTGSQVKYNASSVLLLLGKPYPICNETFVNFCIQIAVHSIDICGFSDVPHRVFIYDKFIPQFLNYFLDRRSFLLKNSLLKSFPFNVFKYFGF